jgi:D-tyrosyl-tRNA(Tyr) deacylase
MRLLIQRVTQASVRIDGKVEAEIGQGILALIGVAAGDTQEAADYLADKLVNLRIFADKAGRMNHSALDINAGLLLVSQFTLYGDCRKGRRPGFDAAAAPADALRL